MPAFGKRDDILGGRRRTVRQRFVLLGSAMLMEGSRSIVVDDICSTGARLRGRDLPPIGSEMILRVGGLDILGTVAWHDKDQCGITFDGPLDPNGVQQLKEAGALGGVLGIV
jgi:hypothetical protein